MTEIRVPDIGDFTDVPVIEIHVSPGDEVALEDPLVTLESDKATMDVPAPEAGTVKQLSVKIGDRVSEGSVLLTLEPDGAGPTDAAREATAATPDAPAATPTRRQPPLTRRQPTAASVEREPAPPPPSVNGAGGDRDAQVVVIGSGPGGYTAAFRAADLGLKTVLIERYDTLGGVCLNVGCIPSKALLHAARVVAEAEEMADHGIRFGKAKIDLDALRAWKASVVGKLTGGLAGLAKQRKVEVDHRRGVVDRPEHGDGRRQDGVVRQLHHRGRLRGGVVAGAARRRADLLLDRGARAALGPQAADGDRLRDHRPRDGDRVRRARVKGDDGRAARSADPGVRPRPGQAAAQADLGRGTRRSISAPRSSRSMPPTSGLAVKLSSGASETFDGILVAIGRRPNGRAVGASKAGVTVDDAGFIPVDRQLRTNVPGIYAIGDVVGGPMLAHKASHEGKVAAEVIAGVAGAEFDPRAIPSVAYTDPEVAWMGLTETEARSNGVEYEKAVFPWAASGRALSLGRDEGMTKLLFGVGGVGGVGGPHSRRLLGAGIVGVNAGELIAETVHALEMGSDAEDIGLTIHPHPTLTETIGFAAEMAEGTITDLMPPRKRPARA